MKQLIIDISYDELRISPTEILRRTNKFRGVDSISVLTDNGTPKFSINARVEIARAAILETREKLRHDFKVHSIAELHPNPDIAFGAMGVLDFIRSGDPDEISGQHLRDAVIKRVRG